MREKHRGGEGEREKEREICTHKCMYKLLVSSVPRRMHCIAGLA